MGSIVVISDVNMTYLAQKYGFGPHPMNKPNSCMQGKVEVFKIS
jgi:hypothetical protein